MKVQLAFGQTNDERFLVLAASAGASTEHAEILSVTFDHEDIFLQQAVAANLSSGDFQQLAATVLLSISQPTSPQRWVEVEMDRHQLALLQLPLRERRPSAALQPSPKGAGMFGFEMDPAQFSQMLMHAPTPFVVLAGPDHVITFCNAPYAAIMGYQDPEELLGKTIRAVLPELQGQPFYRLLDTVYRTGTAHVGREIKANLMTANRGQLEEFYFDFVYHPVRDSFGEVAGILVQAADVTSRVLAHTVSRHREELLHSQWAELESIYNNSPVGMCLIDASTFRLLRINRKQAELMGSSIPDLLGKTLADVSGKLPDFAKLIALVAENKSIRNTVVQEDSASPGNPGQSWLVNITPALGVSGEVTTLSAIFLELSRALMPESGLEASNDLVSDVLENISDAVFVLDRAWNFSYLNSRARGMLENGDHLLGLNIWTEFPLAVDKLFWSNYHRTMDQRIATSFVESYPGPKLLWREVHAYPSRDGIAVFFRDITSEKLEEEALRESEERYRMTLDLNPQIPWIMTPDGYITEFGSRWFELSGQSREETLGHGSLAVIHPDDLESFVTSVTSSLASGLPFDAIWRMKRISGGFCWMRTRGAAVRDDAGTILRWQGTTEDVDELIHLRAQADLLASSRT